MRWARAVVALGAVLLVLGFAVAVAPVTTTVGGQVERCDPVLDPALLAGQPSRPSTGTTPAERAGAQRVEAACGPTERRRGWAAWGSLGLGAVVLLVGVTAVREAGSTGRPGVRREGERAPA